MAETFILHNNNAKKLLTKWKKKLIHNKVSDYTYHPYKLNTKAVQLF